VDEENENGDELDLDQVEEEMAAQYGSDEDEYDSAYLNFNVKTMAPNANQLRAQVLESNSDAETWKIEVERVIPRLKLAAKAGKFRDLLAFKNLVLTCVIDTRDWRSRLQLLTQYSANVSNAMASSQSLLEKMSTEIEKNLERIQTRENYMNSQLSTLLSQYSKTQEHLKQLEEKYRGASGK
jgi:intraflagellar transport protein 57